MVGFIVIGHGKFPSGMTDSLKMFFDSLENYTFVDFKEGQNTNEFSEELKSKINGLKKECNEVIIFADLFGGTPFNQAMMLIQNAESIDIVTPACLPMLMEAINSRYREDITKDMIISNLESGFKDYFINAKNETYAC